ncbi:hypothetical protein BDP55DRAFT_629861 [Colletotrichum godetiae]|uniref:Uncharacterized protein n=1 Tax=Colletotrichum godetiae TaxID=1209918 RepID=A0AAJ0AQ11_9PEZI|nr:uncharacterized protein BDP55DRAFT_629861 [Colletotrichum godetiae]KAK1688259.1 hypothetical protein BDP55DRAFT_629861 [Colletotrichum godetiae]
MNEYCYNNSSLPRPSLADTALSPHLNIPIDTYSAVTFHTKSTFKQKSTSKQLTPRISSSEFPLIQPSKEGANRRRSLPNEPLKRRNARLPGPPPALLQAHSSSVSKQTRHVYGRNIHLFQASAFDSQETGRLLGPSLCSSTETKAERGG